ncbi:MAG: hypothetical protein GYA33_05880 [Thermogutta sp.]|nr:hypothetical protein [Thermogutta sp.]
MRKRHKASRKLESEALRVAADLAIAGSRTAERWLNEVEAGERKASLASLIACEWRPVAPRLARMIEDMDDAEAEAVLRGPVRRLIRERLAKALTDERA